MRSSVIAMAAIVTAGIASLPIHAQTAEDAFGLWLHPDNGSHLEVYKCGDGLCAKIVKVADGQQVDDKNPQPDLRKRSIVDLIIMSDAQKAGANQWKGSLYNPADGGTYSGTLTVKSRTSIDMSGCTLVVICKTVTWTRLD